MCWEVKANLNWPTVILKIIAAIHEYEAFQIQELNYQLETKITNSGVQFSFISVGMRWMRIRIQFWLNSRIDLTLGVHSIGIAFKYNLSQSYFQWELLPGVDQPAGGASRGHLA